MERARGRRWVGEQTTKIKERKFILLMTRERKKERRRRKEAVKACEMYKTYKVV